MQTAQSWPGAAGSRDLAGVGAWLQPSPCMATAGAALSSGQAIAVAFHPSVDTRPSTARIDSSMRRRRGMCGLYAQKVGEATLCARRGSSEHDQRQYSAVYRMIALQSFRSRNSSPRLLSSPDTGGGGSSRPPVWTGLFAFASRYGCPIARRAGGAEGNRTPDLCSAIA